MVIIVLTACPVGLRGHLTRWLLEVAPGVFVGKVSARVREEMWLRVMELSKDGRALMVQSARNEQGMQVRTLRHDWDPVDIDGLQLMMRPAQERETVGDMRPGWSSVGRRRAAGRRAK